MILTTCPACAAPLAHDAPRCVRCWTRYSTQFNLDLTSNQFQTCTINYAISLVCLKRFEEAKSLLRKVMPVARRVLGENASLTLVMRWTFAMALYNDTGATLEDLREAATTLEDAERIARRVFGGAHPTTTQIEIQLQGARLFLSARESS